MLLLEQQSKQCSDFQVFPDYNDATNNIKKIVKFEKDWAESMNTFTDINDREVKLFGFESEFEDMQFIEKNLQTFSKLWKDIGQF